MLKDEVEQFTKLTGRDGWHTPIGVIGAYLDGYERGLEETRPKGKWIEIMYTEDRTGMKCSECGYRYGGIFGSNYCPHCGADMRGDEA